MHDNFDWEITNECCECQLRRRSYSFPSGMVIVEIACGSGHAYAEVLAEGAEQTVLMPGNLTIPRIGRRFSGMTLSSFLTGHEQ